jgi:N-acetylneuraminic acid mutarotase
MYRPCCLLVLLAGCQGESEDTDVQNCADRPIDTPSGRGELDGVWDETHQRMVFFGGNEAVPVNCAPGATAFVGETWSYERDCDNFRRIETDEAPRKRGRYAIGLDSSSGRMLLHGGRFRAGTSGDYTIFGDTWAFDMATDTWTKISGQGLTDRSNHAGAVIGDTWFVFGGNSASSGASFVPLDDTWAFDLATDSWTEIDTTAAPPSRLYHAAASDGDRLFVYGGGDEGAFLGSFFRDLWAFDPADGSWTELHDGSGNAPAARIWANLEFDKAGSRLILFGGHDDGTLGNNNELWSFDLDSLKWKRLAKGDVYNAPQNDVCDFPADFTTIDEDAPERRDAAASTVAGGEMILFGGKTDCGNVNDVWTLNFASETWTNVARATEGEVCLRAYQECSTMCF